MKLALIDVKASYFEIRIYMYLKKKGMVLSQLKSCVRVASDLGLFSWISDYLNFDTEKVIVFSSDGASSLENMKALAGKINSLRKISTSVSSINIETRLPIRDFSSFLLISHLIKQK